uniref:Antirepressor protein C-terminal domain-containing protein n=2 Tax=Pandoraea faecigallinarum TaxID=656179 RepID=A0A0H3WPH7_9BURK
MRFRERAEQGEAIGPQQTHMLRAFTRLADTTGTLCIRDAANVLVVRPLELTAYLESQGWIYPHGDEWRANQERITSGLLTQREIPVRLEGRGRTQVRISQKGITKLAQAFECLAAA